MSTKPPVEPVTSPVPGIIPEPPHLEHDDPVTETNARATSQEHPTSPVAADKPGKLSSPGRQGGAMSVLSKLRARWQR